MTIPMKTKVVPVERRKLQGLNQENILYKLELMGMVVDITL
jgi:hypothetical protein